MPLKRREQSVYHNYKYPSPNEVYYRTYRRRHESSLDGHQRRAAADKLQEKAKKMLQQLNPFNRKLKSSVRGRSHAGPSHAGRSQTTHMRDRGRSHTAPSRHGNVFRRDDHRPISSERFLTQVAMRAETTMPKMKQRKVCCYCCYCLGLSVAPPDHCKKNRLSRPTITFTSDSGSFDKGAFDNFRGRTDWIRNYGRKASSEKKRGRRSYSCHHVDMDYGQAARDFVRDRYNIDLGPKQRVKKYTRGSWSSLKSNRYSSNRHSSNRHSSNRYPTDWRSKRRTECTSDDSIECSEDGEMESVYSRSTKTSCRTETEKDQSRPTSHDGSSQSKSEDSQDTIDTKPTHSEGQTTNDATTENDTDSREKGKNANSSKSIKDKRKTKEKKANETKRVIPIDSVKIMKEKMNESTEDDNHSNEIRSVFLGSQAILNESQVDEEKSNTETTENESIPEKVEKKAKGSKGKAAGKEKAKKSNKEKQTKSSKEKDRKNSKSKEKNTKKHSKEKKQKKSSEKQKPTKKSKEKNKTNEESKKSKKTSETTNKNRRTIVRIVKTESKPNPVPETKSSLKENPSTRPSSKEKLTTRLSSKEKPTKAPNTKEKPTNTTDQKEGKKNKTTKTRKRIVECPADINADSQMADLIFLMRDCKEKNKLLNLKIAARPASLEF